MHDRTLPITVAIIRSICVRTSVILGCLTPDSEPLPAQLPFPRVDFALSFTTACMHMRRRRRALRTAQSLPGDGEGEGGGSAPAPSWFNLIGDAPIPLAPRTQIPRLERVLLVSQLFAWNVACAGSLIVCTVFWATLVRGNVLLLSIVPAVC